MCLNLTGIKRLLHVPFLNYSAVKIRNFILVVERGIRNDSVIFSLCEKNTTTLNNKRMKRRCSYLSLVRVFTRVGMLV